VQGTDGRRRIVLTAVLCVLGCLSTGPAARAAPGAVTASANPSEVTLTPGGEASGVLLVVNKDSKRVKASADALGATDSIGVEISEKPFVLEPGGSRAIRFKVTRSSEGDGQDRAVEFVVSSARVRATRPPTDPQTVAVLTVKAAASANLVEAKIDSSVETINENRPGGAALILTNPRETSVKVTAIAVSAPAATTVQLTCPSGPVTVEASTTVSSSECPKELAARSQEVLPLAFSTTDSVTPGPRSVLVKISVETPSGSTQSTVTSTSFTLDVFAESDILKAVGVPVFLLLPGVIIVLTAWFLIANLSPWRPLAAGASLGGVVSAATATAILGLAVSLAMAQIYPELTGRLVPGTERDYLKAYGFRDFYYVIAYSFAIAVIVWLAASAGFVVVRALFLPWPHDTPKRLVRKVGMRGLFGGGTTFAPVEVTSGKKGIVLGRRAGEQALVAPRIVATVTGGPADLSQQIDRHATGGHAVRLWLTVTLQSSHVGLAAATGDVDQPRIVDDSDVTVGPGEAAIVSVGTT
jgi:hypothetical protein